MADVLKPCAHETLMCGSGDYYLMCPACGGKWMRTGLGRAEYATLPNGEQVGATPELCQPGFDMSRHWNRRAPSPLPIVEGDDEVPFHG